MLFNTSRCRETLATSYNITFLGLLKPWLGQSYAADDVCIL